MLIQLSLNYENHFLCVKDGPVNSERYLSWADAFLVVYSVDNAESFKGCQPYLQTLSLHNKTCRPQVPIILLGNKLDMDRYRLVPVCMCVCVLMVKSPCVLPVSQEVLKKIYLNSAFTV